MYGGHKKHPFALQTVICSKYKRSSYLNGAQGNSLVVQWLGLGAFTACKV